MACLFKAYVGQDINWNEFCEYTEIIDRLFIQDIEMLKKIFISKISVAYETNESYRLERLSSYGLIRILPEGALLVEDAQEEGISQYGRKFTSIILDKYMIPQRKI